MAMAQAQLQAAVAAQNQVPHDLYKGGPLFDDKPTPEGQIKLDKMSKHADSITRGGQSLGANIRGTDQGAPGVAGLRQLLLQRLRPSRLPLRPLHLARGSTWVL